MKILSSVEKEELETPAYQKHRNNRYCSHQDIIPLINALFKKGKPQEVREVVHHNGIRHTMNYIRERFWTLRRRETVKRSIKRCLICKKLEGKSLTAPETPQLPIGTSD